MDEKERAFYEAEAVRVEERKRQNHRRSHMLQKWGEPQVVDNEGFVRLIDYMGDDNAVPQAARVSYGAGTKTLLEDAQLIRFLMRNEHFSPFAMCQVKLHLRLPIYVHAQFVRHDRFHWNVMSARYSSMPDAKWAPEPVDVRAQGQGNKQVGNGQMEDEPQRVLSSMIKDYNKQSASTYSTLLEEGMCREQARTILPQGQYTEAYVTANLGDWLLFLKARLNPHAQLEIRLFAEAIYSVLSDLFPITMEAFKDYQLDGVKLSAQEMETLKGLLNGDMGCWLDEHGEPTEPVTVNLLLPEVRKALLEVHIPTKRERQEFWKKIT